MRDDQGASLLVARIRIGPPTPANGDSWEIVVDKESGETHVVAIRLTEVEALAFADGFNIGIRQSLAELQARADHLKALPKGWDSYNGEVIDHATADKAVEVAMALAPLFPAYPPQLVPSSDGTVQVEFHSDGFDVEAWVNRG